MLQLWNRAENVINPVWWNVTAEGSGAKFQTLQQIPSEYILPCKQCVWERCSVSQRRSIKTDKTLFRERR